MPSQMAGRGWEAFPVSQSGPKALLVDRDGSGDLSGGPGCPEALLEGRSLFRGSGSGWEVLPMGRKWSKGFRLARMGR